MRTRHSLVLLAVLTAACQTAPSARTYNIARNPEGATLRLTTVSKQRIEAELLAVRDSGIVVLQKDGRVAFAPWRSTDLVVPIGMNQFQVAYGYRMPPQAKILPNLILVSHFPQGMSPDIEKRFLASKGQTEMVVIK